jgi:hypothetical protein
LPAVAMWMPNLQPLASAACKRDKLTHGDVRESRCTCQCAGCAVLRLSHRAAAVLVLEAGLSGLICGGWAGASAELLAADRL